MAQLCGGCTEDCDMINVHETAIVEDARSIGAGTKIWAFSHVSKGAIIGEGCSIGEGVYIGPGVKIGHSCKIQNRAQIYAGSRLAMRCS
jgi:UDP-2-acetamido-3-amino-2,3-dideoxy-glucuronate N-acetyltransferase